MTALRQFAGRMGSFARAARERILELLLPRGAIVRRLEGMSPPEFAATARKAEPFSAARALFSYRDPLVRAAVWELKYRGNKKIAALLAPLLADALTEELAEEALWGANDVIIAPIPLSQKRLRERGWNQSELLLDAIAAADASLSRCIARGLIAKTRDTVPQTSLARRERLKNLTGCFSVPRRESVRGKTVILVDDVTTTGATLAEARKALLAAGAKNVIVIAVAH